MQDTFIKQMSEFKYSFKDNPKAESRIMFGDGARTDLLLLREDEFDKAVPKLMELITQFRICKFPDSSIYICHDPDNIQRKLYVFKFKVGSFDHKFAFLKGVENTDTGAVASAGDFEVDEKDEY